MITINIPNGKSKIKLSNIALVPTIFINIIVLLRATANNIHFDLKQNLLYRLAMGETVYYIKQLGGYWVLIYKKPIDFLDLT